MEMSYVAYELVGRRVGAGEVLFSFFSSKTKSASSAHPSQHSRGASQAPSDLPSWRPSVQRNGSNQDGGYDDVSLSVHSQVDLSRPSFSAPSPTSGDFINSFPSPSYPPNSSSQLPPTSGYPPLRTTFYRLTSILASRSPALLDSLSPALPINSPALASLIHTIQPYTLPRAVLEAYACYDGQDPFSPHGGLLWGLRWMPLDEVETEYLFWRKLEGAGGEGGMWDAFSASTGIDPGNGESGGREHPHLGEEERGGGMEGMKAFPPGWVRSRYSHPGWIPLVSDGMGNYIGVDLDPPPMPSSNGDGDGDGNATASGSGTSGTDARRYGVPGQVIAFGREMDEKVVLFPGDSNGGWGRFLSSFVDDVERGNFARLEVGDGSGSDDEAGGDGDGLGDRSYLEGDRYGEEDDDGACWTMRNEYKRWMAEDSERSLISAVAERSKRQWQHLGVGVSVPASSSSSSRPPLKLVLPEKRTAGTEEDDEALESSTTARPPSINLLISSARPSLEEEQPMNVSLILSPPSPEPASVSLPSPSPTLLVASPPPPPPSHTKHNHLNPMRKGRRAPPPPMPIALPIFGDLESDNPSSYALPQFNPNGDSPHSMQGTPTRERLLDSTFTGERSPVGSLRVSIAPSDINDPTLTRPDALISNVDALMDEPVIQRTYYNTYVLACIIWISTQSIPLLLLPRLLSILFAEHLEDSEGVTRNLNQLEVALTRWVGLSGLAICGLLVCTTDLIPSTPPGVSPSHTSDRMAPVMIMTLFSGLMAWAAYGMEMWVIAGVNGSLTGWGLWVILFGKDSKANKAGHDSFLGRNKVKEKLERKGI